MTRHALSLSLSVTCCLLLGLASPADAGNARTGNKTSVDSTSQRTRGRTAVPGGHSRASSGFKRLARDRAAAATAKTAESRPRSPGRARIARALGAPFRYLSDRPFFSLGVGATIASTAAALHSMAVVDLSRPIGAVFALAAAVPGLIGFVRITGEVAEWDARRLEQSPQARASIEGRAPPVGVDPGWPPRD